MIQDFEFSEKDLKGDLNLLNLWRASVNKEINRLSGAGGAVKFPSGIDLGGSRLMNVGDPKATTDGLSQSSADPMYGATQQQLNMEATGTKLLQTVRQVNNRTQQESYSSFLVQQGSIPPGTNTATVDVSGLTIRIYGPGGVGTSSQIQTSDGTLIVVPYSAFTVPNPAGSVFYYPYWLQLKGVVQLAGPFTADTSQNRLLANMDGQIMIGSVQVDAGGGGGGSGGGGGTGGGGHGCVIIGTRIEPLVPHWAYAVDTTPCREWVQLTGKSGAVLYATETHPFYGADGEKLTAGSLKINDWVIRKRGDEKLIDVCRLSLESFKMKVTMPTGHLFWADGWLSSNVKP